MTLTQAIGQQMRKLREADGVQQGAIAAAARTLGLEWTQATVAAIELGLRQLDVGEFVVLPLIFGEALGRDPRAGGQVLDLTAFLPSAPETVELAPGMSLPLGVVRMLLGGEVEAASAQAPRGPSGPDEVDRKAARKLGCSPDAVLAAAQRRWEGRTLAQERDRRIGGRVEALDARSLQAVRGRVTRALLRELEPIITKRKRR